MTSETLFHRSVRLLPLATACVLVALAAPSGPAEAGVRPNGGPDLAVSVRVGHGHVGHARRGPGFYGWGRPWVRGWGWGWAPYYRLYRPIYPWPRVVYSAYLPNSSTPSAIETDVRPKKATVVLDGREIGQARDFNGTWDLLYLDSGTHQLEFRHPGHRSLELTLHLAPGDRYQIEERLEKGEGVDRKVIGEAKPPRTRPTEGLAPPPTVPEAAGVRRGLLRIRALPEDAAVYLDGEFLARADELARLHGALTVAAGRHVVEVVRPGYAPQRREIEVGAEPFAIEIRLDRR